MAPGWIRPSCSRPFSHRLREDPLAPGIFLTGDIHLGILGERLYISGGLFKSSHAKVLSKLFVNPLLRLFPRFSGDICVIIKRADRDKSTNYRATSCASFIVASCDSTFETLYATFALDSLYV